MFSKQNLKEGNNQITLSVPAGGKRILSITIYAGNTQDYPLYFGKTAFNAFAGQSINVNFDTAKSFYTANGNNYYPVKKISVLWDNLEEILTSSKFYIFDSFIDYSPFKNSIYYRFYPTTEPSLSEYNFFQIKNIDLTLVFANLTFPSLPYYYEYQPPDKSIQLFKNNNGYYFYAMNEDTSNPTTTKIYTQKISLDANFSNPVIPQPNPIYQNIQINILKYYLKSLLKLFINDGSFLIPYKIWSSSIQSTRSLSIDKTINKFALELNKLNLRGKDILDLNLHPFYDTSVITITDPNTTTETYSIPNNLFAFILRTYKSSIKTKLDELENKTFGINFGFKNLKDYNESSLLFVHNPEGIIKSSSVVFEYIPDSDIVKQAILLKDTGDIYIFKNPPLNIPSYNVSIKGYGKINSAANTYKYLFEVQNNTDLKGCNIYCDSYPINDATLYFLGILSFGLDRNYLLTPFDVVYRNIPINMLYVDNNKCSSNIIIECKNYDESFRVIKFFKSSLNKNNELQPYFYYSSKNFNVVNAPIKTFSGSVASDRETMDLTPYNPPSSKPICYFSSNSVNLNIGCYYYNYGNKEVSLERNFNILLNISSKISTVGVLGTIYIYYPVYTTATTYTAKFDVKRVEADSPVGTGGSLTWNTTSFSSCTDSLNITYINSFGVKRVSLATNSGTYSVPADNTGHELFIYCHDNNTKTLLFKKFTIGNVP